MFLPLPTAQDIVWYHTPSKTLIEADALFNLPCEDQKTGLIAKYLFPNFLLRQMSPNTGFHRMTVKAFGKSNPSAFGEAAKVIDSLDFVRLIPCHGAVIQGSAAGTAGSGSTTNAAKAAWRNAYASFVDEGNKTK
jgi:hypothetical protein